MDCQGGEFARGEVGGDAVGGGEFTVFIDTSY